MKPQKWWAAGAVALALSGAASAHEFTCEETVNGVPVYVIDSYPATLHFDFKVTNAAPVPSTALKVEDDFFASLGLWATVPPFTLGVGRSVARGFDVIVHDEAECKRLVGDPLTCGGMDGEFLRIVTDTGETHCSARVICAGHVEGGGDEGGGGGDQGGPGNCEPGKGKKHGLGFWKVHEQMVSACLASGPIDLGIATVSTLPQAEGILWADPAKFLDGTKRDKLDQQRFILARELLVATCNVRVLGAEFVGDEVQQALNLLTSTDCKAIQAFHLKLALDRDCDGKHKVDPGPATPQHAQSIAVDVLSPSGQQCGGTR